MFRRVKFCLNTIAIPFEQTIKRDWLTEILNRGYVPLMMPCNLTETDYVELMADNQVIAIWATSLQGSFFKFNPQQSTRWFTVDHPLYHACKRIGVPLMPDLTNLENESILIPRSMKDCPLFYDERPMRIADLNHKISVARELISSDCSSISFNFKDATKWCNAWMVDMLATSDLPTYGKSVLVTDFIPESDEGFDHVIINCDSPSERITSKTRWRIFTETYGPLLLSDGKTITQLVSHASKQGSRIHVTVDQTTFPTDIVVSKRQGIKLVPLIFKGEKKPVVKKDRMKADWSVKHIPFRLLKKRRGSKGQIYLTDKSQVSHFYRPKYLRRRGTKSRAVIRRRH